MDSRKKDLRRIASHSKGEYQLDDVRTEIWLIANDLSKKHQADIDFLNPEHQDLLIAHTYQKLVRYCEMHVRYAARIDDDDPDGAWPDYSDRLTAGEHEDPLSQLVTEPSKPAGTIVHHSLGDAWLNLLNRCNNNMTSVAYYLKISLGYSYHRFNQALYATQKQYPLPLYVPNTTTIEPRPWRPYRQYRKPTQLAFEFDEGLPFG